MARECPICGKTPEANEQTAKFKPFCSKRCADLDLGKWLNGAYGIPASETDEDDEDSLAVPDGDGELPQ